MQQFLHSFLQFFNFFFFAGLVKAELTKILDLLVPSNMLQSFFRNKVIGMVHVLPLPGMEQFYWQILSKFPLLSP